MKANLKDLTIGEIEQIVSIFGLGPGPRHGVMATQAHPYEVGKAYFIRTVTHHYTGRLLAVYEQELMLEEAAWIADDGRFAQAVAKGEFSEVEPYPDDAKVIIGRGSILDAVIFEPKLPRSQK